MQTRTISKEEFLERYEYAREVKRERKAQLRRDADSYVCDMIRQRKRRIERRR
jgi:hypothetical protein